MFALLDSNILRDKEIPETENDQGVEHQMPPSGKTTNTASTSASSSTTSTQRRATTRTDAAKIREGLTKVRNGSVGYVRQTAERSVDVPVGAVLTVADRVTEAVEPFTSRQAANHELKSIRTRVERELNRLERRGSGARRKTRTRVRQNRNRLERELRQRRRKVQTTVKQRRAKAETNLKRAQSVVQERVSALV
jgi:uncharacterized protein (DUF1800 family)